LSKIRQIPTSHRRWALCILLLPAIVVAVLATACGSATTAVDNLANAQPRTDAEANIVVAPGQPIVIGVSDSLTGSEAEAGKEDRDAVTTSLMRWKASHGDQVLGHDIQVRAEDDGCTESDITIDAASRLLRTPGLVGVLGPGCSAGAEKAIPFYSKAGIVTISGSATQSDLAIKQPAGGFFFRTSYRSELQGMIGGLFVATNPDISPKTAYLIDDGESYGRDLIDAAQRVMESNGVTVTRETVPRGTVDFSALAKEIADARPGFVGFGGFNPETVLLYRQLRDAGYTGSFGAGDAAASVSTFIEPVGAEAAQGVYFVGCPLTLPDAFLEDFKKVHGSAPEASAFTAQYADAATILLDAVSGVAKKQDDGSLVIDPKGLRDAVQQTRLLAGVSGHLAFDGYGDRVGEGGDLAEQARDLGLAACVVDNGAFTNLFP
jgi:branched-chain amino acid transport system substrate-binding protein